MGRKNEFDCTFLATFWWVDIKKFYFKNIFHIFLFFFSPDRWSSGNRHGCFIKRRTDGLLSAAYPSFCRPDGPAPTAAEMLAALVWNLTDRPTSKCRRRLIRSSPAVPTPFGPSSRATADKWATTFRPDPISSSKPRRLSPTSRMSGSEVDASSENSPSTGTESSIWTNAQERPPSRTDSFPISFASADRLHQRRLPHPTPPADPSNPPALPTATIHPTASIQRPHPLGSPP